MHAYEYKLNINIGVYYPVVSGRLPMACLAQYSRCWLVVVVVVSSRWMQARSRDGN